MKTRFQSKRFALSWTLLSAAWAANAIPPAVDSQPQSQSVVLTQPAVFGVTAGGTAPLHYQWRKDGVPLAGATNDQIILARAQFSDAGLYSVTVSNAEGGAISANAPLTVRAPMGGELDYSFVQGGALDERVDGLAVQPDGKVVIVGQFNLMQGAVRGGIARVNADGSTDYTFMHGLSGANNGAVSVALQSDGKVLVGGNFTNINGLTRNRIARLNRDGTVDTSFQNGLAGADSYVDTIAVQSDGKVLIGGSFFTVNGVTRSGIARLNSDGTLDTGFQNGLSGASGDVLAIAVQTNGRILIGGSFQSLNGTNRGHIARLNTNGGLDTSFQNGMPGASSDVFSIGLQPDGKILLGGYFTSVNSTGRGRIARLNMDGSLDTSFSSASLGANDYVRSLAVQPDGKVVLGGYFTTINNSNRSRIARLNTDGTLDNGFQNGLAGANDVVNVVSIQSAGKLVIGGGFTSVNRLVRNSVARLNADGSLDTGPVAGLYDANNEVFAVAIQSDHKVVIAGDFTTVGGTNRNFVARLEADGRLDAGFLDGLSGANGNITALALQTDGKILVGGNFSTVNDVARDHLARLNPDGTLDGDFLNGMAGVSASVISIVVQDDGRIVIGGQFESVNGVTRNHIARLNTDGTLDAGFQNGLSGGNGDVYSVALQGNGRIFVAGNFTTMNGVSRGRVARLNSDGTLDNTFLNGLSGADDEILSMAVRDDGQLYIGGGFAAVNGKTRARIALLNTNGALDANFLNAGAGVTGSVYSVSLHLGGKLLIAGDFKSVNGVIRNSIARLNTDGTLDNTFLNGLSGTDREIASMAVRDDGQVWIVGGFTTVNGVPRHGIAPLAPDGTDGVVDVGFQNPITGANADVLSIVPQSSGKILLGGAFTNVNGIGRNRLVRLLPDGRVDDGFLNGLPGANGSVKSFATQPDGRVLVGGAFSTMNGVSRGRLARLNTDGTLDTNFLGGVTGANNDVDGVAVQSDGRVVIVGNFTSVNSVSRGHLARLNTNGTLDAGFQNGLSGSVSEVLSVVLQPDDKALIGGFFSTVNGTARGRIARLNTDGSLDASFLNGLAGANGSVRSVALQGDGKVIIGGQFNSVNGISRIRIARLNPDGTLDTNFLSGLSGANEVVYSVAAQNDGKVLLGGFFTVVNGVNRRYLARLNADGTLDASFQAGLPGANGLLWAVAPHFDGGVLVGGQFTTMNGMAAWNFAKLWGADFAFPRLRTITRSGPTIDLTWDAMPGRTYRVEYKQDISGNSWTSLPGNTLATNATAGKSDASLNGSPQRFYRVGLLP